MKGARIPYSAAEMSWLEANRMLVISDYHRAFITTFGRHDVTAAHLHGLRKRRGWKVGRAPGRTKGRRRRYSAAEISWLSENRAMALGEYHAAFVATFGREDVTPTKLHSLRKREGYRTGRSGRFAKGSVPWSKGRKLPYSHGGAETQFKQGQKPHNTKGAGHERVDEHGYVWIIVDEPNPWSGAATRPIHKHRWLWEQTNGPLPEGTVLKCLGDRLNTDPSNWELVPRGLLPRLNGKSGRAYDQAPAELKPAIMAIAKLEHRARARARGQS